MYVESLVNCHNNTGEEIWRRVTLGNRSFNQKLPTKNSPLSNFKWKDEPTFLVFDWKILRSIFDDVRRISNDWRRRYNRELYQLYNELEIDKYIKIRWLCHVQSLKMLNGYRGAASSTGRTREWGEDAVELHCGGDKNQEMVVLPG